MNATAVYRQIAIGDLLLFSALAVPGLGRRLVELLVEFNHVLDWSGALQMSAGVSLLIHLTGSLGAALAWLRLGIGPQTQSWQVSIAVKLLACALFAYAVGVGAPAIFLVIGLVDLVQALILMAFYKIRPAQ